MILREVERAYFAKVTSTRFPEGKVYYLFEEGVRQKTERMVINAMRKISQNVPCIKFLKVTPANTNHIPHRLIISDKLPGCKVTKVGYRGEWHTSSLLNVEFDKCLTEGVIEHELMHILGAVHTHTRPDRNNFVELDTTNIKTGYQRQFAMVRSSLDKTDYKYDYNSAMHYGPGYFAIDKSKSVLSVKPPNIGEFSSSQTISERDIRSLRDWYGCGKRCPFDQETCEQSDRLKSWHNSTDISDFDSRDKLEESDTIITKLTSIVNGDTAADTVQRLTRRSISGRLRIEFTDCTEPIDPKHITSYVASRLVPLSKKPTGIRPIGIGEILRRLVGKNKCIMLHNAMFPRQPNKRIGKLVKAGQTFSIITCRIARLTFPENVPLNYLMKEQHRCPSQLKVLQPIL
eukprot:sb/3465329/